MIAANNAKFRANLPLIGVIGLAVALRLAYILIFGQTLSLQTSGYDVYATNLVAGHGYTRFADLHPDSDLPPLYSFFLAGVYITLGRSAITVALVQIVFDMVMLVALYAIGRRVGGSENDPVKGNQVGLLAVAFTGCYPYLLFQNLSVNDTGIFIMLLTCAVWTLYQARDHNSWRWAALAGLLLGIAALTKTLVILLLPLVVIWWWIGLSRKKSIVMSAALLIMFAVLPGLWLIRNIQVQHAFVLLSTNDGSNLYQGNNPFSADELLHGYDVQWLSPQLPKAPGGLSEIQQADWFRTQALTYLRDHAGDIPKLMLVKFLVLWSPDLRPYSVPPYASLANDAVLQYEQPSFNLARVIHVIYFTPLLILAILGLWRCILDRRPIAPLLFVFAAITVTYLVYHPSTRYRSPADPLVFVLSAYGVLWLFQAVRKPSL